jgi:hypothetical protein
LLLACLTFVDQGIAKEDGEQQLIAALEINGWKVSDATPVVETPSYCGVWYEAVREKLNMALIQRLGDYVIFPKSTIKCDVDHRRDLMQLTVPKEYLREETLSLTDTPSIEDIATNGVGVMPAIAIDSYITGRDRNFNATVSVDHFVARAANIDFSEPSDLRRYSLEYIGDDRSQIVAGDVRVERGIVSTLQDMRGLYYSSVAPPLRSDESLAEALVSVEAPSRAFFLSENGQTFGETGLLAPGNYRLEGLPVNTAPGQLEAVVTDQNGHQQKILLPWSRSNRFIGAGKSIVEAYLGVLRLPDLSLDNHLIGGANYLHGLSSSETFELTTEAASDKTLLAGELSSRRVPNTILTGGLAMECGSGCRTGSLFEGSWTINKTVQLYGQFADWPDINDDLAYKSRQLGMTVQAKDSTALSASYSYTLQDGVLTNSTVIALSNHFDNGKLGNDKSWILQVRKDAGTPGSGWGVYFALILAFDRVPNWTLFPSITKSPGNTQQSAIGFSENPQGPYGMQLSGSVSPNSSSSTDLFGRYQTKYGEIFASSDGTGRLTGGVASRLWLTNGNAYLAPYTDNNLIIADVGIPGVHTENAGSDVGVSGEDGEIILRRVAPWNKTTVSLDADDLPININAGPLKLKLTTQLDHVYYLNFKKQWSASYSWQVFHDGKPLGKGWKLYSRAGPTIFLGADGFADLPKDVKLPLVAKDPQETLYICQAQQEKDTTAPIKKLLCDTLFH